MLQRIRDSFGPWVAGTILGLLAVTFIFWGIDFSLNTTTFAAKVNGENIPLAEFDRELQAEQNRISRFIESSSPRICGANFAATSSSGWCAMRR